MDKSEEIIKIFNKYNIKEDLSFYKICLECYGVNRIEYSFGEDNKNIWCDDMEKLFFLLYNKNIDIVGQHNYIEKHYSYEKISIRKLKREIKLKRILK